MPLLAWQVLLGGYLAGVVCLVHPAAGALALVCIAILGRARIHARPLAALVLMLAAFGLGAGRAWLAAPQAPSTPEGTLWAPSWTLDTKSEALTGRVVEAVTRPEGRVRLVLERVETEHGPLRAPGQARVLLVLTARPGAQALPPKGAPVRAQAAVKPVRGLANPGGWDTQSYWERQGVFFRGWAREVAWDAPPDLRGRLMARVEQALGGEHTGLLPVFLFGERFGLSAQAQDLFRLAGLSHSLALSGLHLGFMAALGWGLARGLGRLRPEIYLRMPRPKLAVLCAAPLVLAYLWLGQGSPSLVRASVMFACWGGLLLMGRGAVLIDGLLLAVALLTLADPMAVYDIGLQLSALAVAGIGLAGLPAAAWLERRLPEEDGASRLVRGAATVLTVSLAANLGTLPLLVWYFGGASPHLYWNVAWLPALGFFVMPLSLLGLVLSMADPAWAAPVLGLADWACASALALLAWLRGAGMLWESAALRPLWPAWAGYWLAVLGAAVWFARRRKGALMLAAALALLAAPSAWSLWQEARPNLRLTLLDTGQSQALVLEPPAGGRVLLDGGGVFGGFDMGRAVTGPALALNRPPRLAWAVASHPDADHLGGLVHPLETFRVGGFAWNGQAPENEALAGRLDAALDRAVLAPVTLRAGDVLELGGGARLECLWPPEPLPFAEKNLSSLILRLTWRGRPLALVPGDAEAPALAALVATGADLAAEVLVLPHHGSADAALPAFYDAVGPDLALAAYGFLNVYGYPHQPVRQALRVRGVPLYATAEHGQIRLTWAPDGGRTLAFPARPMSRFRR